MVGNAEIPQCATWPIVACTDRLLFQCDTKTENVLLEQTAVRAKTPARAMPEALGEQLIALTFHQSLECNRGGGMRRVMAGRVVTTLHCRCMCATRSKTLGRCL